MVIHFSRILRECDLTAIIFQTCSFRVEIYSWRTRLLKQEEPSEEKITQVNRISFLHLVTYITGPFPRSPCRCCSIRNRSLRHIKIQLSLIVRTRGFNFPSLCPLSSLPSWILIHRKQCTGISTSLITDYVTRFSV